jgi:hypothetical protein
MTSTNVSTSGDRRRLCEGEAGLNAAGYNVTGLCLIEAALHPASRPLPKSAAFCSAEDEA